ncbi:MAG: hypothetical protein E6Q27_08760 [Aeromicrobium sp.]|nr:MAG: hypothetical protein E6Q27_08760 [Aeromicrobium sp.]
MKGHRHVEYQGQSRPALRVVSAEHPSSDDAARAEEVSNPIDRLTDAITQACGDEVLLLIERTPWGHARPLPLVVTAPSGVFLVEPLSFPGAQVRADPTGANFSVDSVLHYRLTRTMNENSDAFQAAVETGPCPEVPVTTLFCVLDGKLPYFSFDVDGFDVVKPKRLIRKLKRKGLLGDRERESIHLDLARRLVREC